MSQITNGKKISAQVAGDEMSAYLDMMKPTRPLIVDFCQQQMDKSILGPLNTATPQANPVTFFSKDVNAFVFDKDLVTRFFETNGPFGIQTPADVLLVFLGMVKEDVNNLSNVGTPTVVLAGCHLLPDGSFKSMNLPGEEATEYPPKKIVQFFPERLEEMINEMSNGQKEKVNNFKSELNKHLPLRFKIEE